MQFYQLKGFGFKMQTKKRSAKLLSCVIGGLISFPALSADAYTVIPRIETGLLDYDSNFETPGAQSNQFQLFHVALRVGVTVAWDEFYIDGYFQSANDDSDSISMSTPFGPYFERYNGDRSECTVSFGYSGLGPVSVFAGYRKGEADSSGNLGSTYEFNSDAVFVGGSYSWRIEDKGVLSVNLAYANLYDANLKQSLPFISFNYTGDGNGLKSGVSWNGRLTDDLGYSFVVDQHRYKYDNLEDTAINSRMNMKETEINFRIGLAYAF